MMFIAKPLCLLIGLASAAGQWGNSRDSSTYSNIDQVNTKHVHLDLSVDWDNKRLFGMATHKMMANMDDLTEVFFDIEGIDIQSTYFRVNDSQSWQSVTWTKDRPHPFGDYLQLTIPAQANGSTFDIGIFYNTNENQTSVSWMTKEQTACKTLKYLFSKCEMIQCRSVAPL